MLVVRRAFSELCDVAWSLSMPRRVSRKWWWCFIYLHTRKQHHLLVEHLAASCPHIYIYSSSNIDTCFSRNESLDFFGVLSRGSKSVPDRFLMPILLGRCETIKLSHGLIFYKLRRHSQGEIWPESCWQKDSRGKEFAVRKLDKHIQTEFNRFLRILKIEWTKMVFQT